MAKADVKMPDEFLAKLSRLGSQTDTIAEKVLQAGGEVALDKVRSNLKAVVVWVRETKANPAPRASLNALSVFRLLWLTKTATMI